MEASYYEQPIIDALRACASGEFANWTPEQHEALALWTTKYPDAIGWAAAQYLAEHLPAHSSRPRLRLAATHTLHDAHVRARGKRVKQCIT